MHVFHILTTQPCNLHTACHFQLSAVWCSCSQPGSCFCLLLTAMWQWIKLDASCLPGPSIPEDAGWQKLGSKSAERFNKLLQKPNPENESVILSWSRELRCKYSFQEICSSEAWGPMHLLKPVNASRQWVLLRPLIPRVFHIEIEEAIQGECTEWKVSATSMAGKTCTVMANDCSGLAWLHKQVGLAFDASFCELPLVKLVLGTRILRRNGTMGAFMRGGKKRRCEEL